MGDGAETDAFKEDIVAAVGDFDQISKRLRRSEEKTTQTTSEPVL